MPKVPSLMIAVFLSAPLFALLAIPLITLLGQLSSIEWLWGASESERAVDTLLLSLKTSTISVLVIALTGTPLAWLMANRRAGYWQAVTKMVIIAPMFLPPSIVGLTLLSALNREGWLGALLGGLSSLPFTTSAVIIAQVTVSAPLYVIGAFAAFQRMDPALTEMARTLGLSAWESWRRVTVPLLLPGLLIALSLSWARALGEFGATLLFAGLLPGVTETAPLAIYLELERGTTGAMAISLGLIAYMLPLLIVLVWLNRSYNEHEVSD